MSTTKSIVWPMKLECCGAPLLGVNDELSMALTQKKLADGKTSGGEYLCAACPYCQMQFDTVQQILPDHEQKNMLPSLVYPQLLGLAMGMDKETLGFNLNKINISNIDDFIEIE